MAPILWAAMQETVRSTRFRYGWSANLRGCSPLFGRVGKNTQNKEPDMSALANQKEIKSPIQPNLEWYMAISTANKLSPRCPFASVNRCPRYYQSISLLGNAAIATSIEPEEDQRLLDKWKYSDLWPVIWEQETAVTKNGPEDTPSQFINFCPEVSFDCFGWFATNLSKYADELDIGVAHKNLANEGASGNDWRWEFRFLETLHYAECPFYSPLTLGTNYNTEKPKIVGFVPSRREQ